MGRGKRKSKTKSWRAHFAKEKSLKLEQEKEKEKLSEQLDQTSLENDSEFQGFPRLPQSLQCTQPLPYTPLHKPVIRETSATNVLKELSSKGKRALATKLHTARMLLTTQSAHVYVSRRMWELMHLLVNRAVDKKGDDVEISGLGTIDLTSQDRKIAIEINDLWFLKQANSTGLTSQFPDAVEKWLNDNFPKWKTDTLNRPNILWWHKHPGATFFSGRDEQTIENLCKMSGMVLSIVTNTKREVEMRLDYNLPLSELPVKINISRHNNLHIIEPDFIGQELRDAVNKEWDEKIEVREFGGWGEESTDAKLHKTAKQGGRIGVAAQKVLTEMDKPCVEKGYTRYEKSVKQVVKVHNMPWYDDNDYTPVTLETEAEDDKKDEIIDNAAKECMESAASVPENMAEWLEDWEDKEMVHAFGEVCKKCEEYPLHAKMSRVTGYCIECRRGMMEEFTADSESDDINFEQKKGRGGWLMD